MCLCMHDNQMACQFSCSLSHAVREADDKHVESTLQLHMMRTHIQPVSNVTASAEDRDV